MEASPSGYTCTAIPFNSQTACGAPADPKPPNYFCTYHARQCQALYSGYKRRSAELEKLEKQPPKSLPRNWANISYTGVDDINVLVEVRSYLWRKYRLLTRCLEARDWHHAHFYKDTSDFGHQAYIDQLISHRLDVNKALTRIEKRSLEVTHERAKWQVWITELEKEEEAHHEAEKKKNKAGTALFKENAERLAELKKEEEVRRKEETEQGEVWDPIEDIIGEQRAGYVALVKVLIQHAKNDETVEQLAKKRAEELKMEFSMASDPNVALGNALSGLQLDQESVKLRRMEMLRRGQGAMVINARPIPIPSGADPEAHTEANMIEEYNKIKAKRKPDPDIEEVYMKLGELTSMHRGANSYDLTNTQSTIQQLRQETSRIREYLLIRIITINRSLLGVGLECKSVDEFLHHSDIRNTDLRDLAIALNRPSLKQIRNACADYWASLGGKLAASHSAKDLEEEEERAKLDLKRMGFDIEKLIPGYVYPGPVGKEEQKITVCGKVIHNYPEDHPMSRRGWFQFAMLTGTGPGVAYELCNSWEEFNELNHLLIQGYFCGLPGVWDGGWPEPVTLQHARRCGFCPYFYSMSNFEIYEPKPGPPPPGQRRLHSKIEQRNIACAVMGRDVIASRRFLAIANAWRSEVFIWARDCLTGEVIYDPPEEEKWLVRTKSGTSRLSKQSWTYPMKFDKKWKKNIDRSQAQWKVNFKDRIDIVMWSRSTCDFGRFSTMIITILHKALKYRDHLAVVTPTLRIYEECAMEEEGPEGERTKKAQEVLAEIAKYRANHSEKDIKGDNDGMYYDDVDMEVDVTYAVFDEDKHWAFENMGLPRSLIEIGKGLTQTTDPEEQKELEAEFAIKMYLEAIENPEQYKEQGPGDGKSWLKGEMKHMLEKKRIRDERLLLGESPLPSDYDDDDVDSYVNEDDSVGSMDSVDAFWADVRCDAQDLEEMAEKFADGIHQMQLEEDPEAEARFYQAKNHAIQHLGKKLNTKRRARFESRERELLQSPQGGGIRFTPKNLTYCTAASMFLFDRGDPDHVMGIDAEFYESILDYDRRAKTPPRDRPWKVPQKVYEDWDALQASMPDESSFGRGKWDYPFSQRLKVLKHIMNMWKDGVIEPTSDCFSGPIIPGRVAEDDKTEYMFWDCRFLEEHSIIRNPHPETPVPDKFYLRNEIEKWEEEYPGSCYSFFKVKSEELYWLPELHAGDGFPTLQDPYGRCWKWKKHPKDLKYGECEMHNVLERLRLGPGNMGPDSVYAHVRCRVDTFITMHKSKREAKREMPVIGSFFRKRPHGSDIDWARSFLNVDAKFLLKDMNEGWWE